MNYPEVKNLEPRIVLGVFIVGLLEGLEKPKPLPGTIAAKGKGASSNGF